MGKSGKVNRAEPTDLTWVKKLPDCAELFQQAGWLKFFKKIDGFNAQVSCKFAKGLKEDMIHNGCFEIQANCGVNSRSY